jgi:hypothetical protein
MINSKKILITTESREIFIVRLSGKTDIRGFCETCAFETEMVTLDNAVSLFGISALKMLRAVESGEIHFLETTDGHLLLCCESLKSSDRQP